MHTQKPVGQDAALEKLPQFPLDKSGNGTAILQGEEGFHMPSQRLVQHGLFGLTRSIGLPFLKRNTLAGVDVRDGASHRKTGKAGEMPSAASFLSGA